MAKEPEGTSFEVHLTGNITGKTWDGKFRAKAVLSFAEQAKVERLVRDMLGQGPYDGMDSEVVASARILSALAVRITEAPEWWAGGANHADTNLLMKVYEETDAVAKEHIDGVLKRGEVARDALREGRTPEVAPRRLQTPANE